MAPTRPAQKMTKASPGKVRPTRTQDRTKDLDILFLWQCLELFNEKYRVIDFQDLADALGMTKTEARDRYARIRKDVLDISCPAQKADAKEETEEAEAETDVERSSEEDARMAVFRGH